GARGMMLFALLLLAQAGLFQELSWRCIGPYRGGRTKSVAGVTQRPGTFYMAAVNGGIWKSDDYGRIWSPIFDDQPTGSIGALAVAPSNPDILYAGSGEGMHRPDLSTGDGVYKSIDGGKSWRHLGLRDGQQIPQIAIDPRDPNRLFVAVLGHPYGPNEERGLFRSVDGGETWSRSSEDPRVGERAEDTAEVKVHPSNPDVVFVASVVLWRSTDGGKTFSAFRGAPGGDDYQKVWIDPQRPETMLVGSDQGAIVTVNGGASWSSWYNQPTAQMFHVTADNAFPFRLCGG